jgi:hypothetical protein
MKKYATQDREKLDEFFSKLTIAVTGPLHTEATSKVPVTRVTERLLLQIRDALPLAPIILSTWDKPKFQEKIEGIEVVLSEDPGPQVWGKHQSNLNRQIVSSRNAVLKTESEYVLRIRTDFLFFDFSKILVQFSKQLHRDQISHSKLGVLDHSQILFWKPYFICDFLQIGTTNQVKKYWDAPLQTLNEFKVGHKETCIHEFDKCHLKDFPERFAPEQYLALNYIFGPNAEYPIKGRCQNGLVEFHKSFKDFNSNFLVYPIGVNDLEGRFSEISQSEGSLRSNLTRITRNSSPLVATLILVFYKVLKLMSWRKSHFGSLIDSCKHAFHN